MSAPSQLVSVTADDVNTVVVVVVVVVLVVVVVVAVAPVAPVVAVVVVVAVAVVADQCRLQRALRRLHVGEHAPGVLGEHQPDAVQRRDTQPHGVDGVGCRPGPHTLFPHTQQGEPAAQQLDLVTRPSELGVERLHAQK